MKERNKITGTLKNILSTIDHGCKNQQYTIIPTSGTSPQSEMYYLYFIHMSLFPCCIKTSVQQMLNNSQSYWINLYMCVSSCLNLCDDVFFVVKRVLIIYQISITSVKLTLDLLMQQESLPNSAEIRYVWQELVGLSAVKPPKAVCANNRNSVSYWSVFRDWPFWYLDLLSNSLILSQWKNAICLADWCF